MGIHLHGEWAACNQGGFHKAGTNVGDVYIGQSLDAGQLLQALQIMGGETLGGGLGRGGTQAFGGSNKTDTGNLSINLLVALKIPERL